MKVFEKILNMVNIHYIELVYRTSKITYSGASDLLFNSKSNNENYIISFWHGESFCLYPLLKGRKQYVLATKDRRGDYITTLCNYFGYSTIRIPDNFEDGKYISRIRHHMKESGGGNLVITLDGPIGPYHQPKEFLFFMSLLMGYKILLISATVKYKIKLTKRWDNFIIPLPFNKLNFHFHTPLLIDKADLKAHFLPERLQVKDQLEKYLS